LLEVQQTSHKQEIKPHKVRYYLERRDPDFKQKMAEVLCVYREVELIKETAATAKPEPSDVVANQRAFLAQRRGRGRALGANF
jgi:hypothetical protein